MTGRYPFTDLASGAGCELVVPAGGAVHPQEGQLRIGVAHPGCGELADLVVALDAFYCSRGCGWNGRVSGAWALDMIHAQAGA